MRLGKHPRRILTGLPSIGDQGTGGSALGPSGIVALGERKLAFTIGGGGTPLDRATLPASARRIGTLVAGLAQGQSWSANACGRPDALRGAPRPGPPGGRQRPDRPDPSEPRFLTTDSGGNDLLRAGGGDPTRVLATFGNRTVTNPFPRRRRPDAGGTDRGSGRAGRRLYVSELTGFPFPKGAASIFRVVPGPAPTVWATGLTNVTDLRWYRGPLYAVQIANNGLLSAMGVPVGSLVKVNRGSAATRVGPTCRRRTPWPSAAALPT